MEVHMKAKNQKADFIIGMLFAALTVIAILLFFTNDSFFKWAFDRHHNVLSWYIRPLFIVPIVYFAFKKSWTGIMASIFCLFTSMFWFPAPESVSDKVVGFLNFEQEYLKGSWDISKIIVQLAVPAFFAALIYTAWHRSIKALIGVIIASAVLKVVWSALFAGADGLSIIKPAVSGVVICIAAVFYYKRRNRKSKTSA
jgi:hypothetical protein